MKVCGYGNSGMVWQQWHGNRVWVWHGNSGMAWYGMAWKQWHGNSGMKVCGYGMATAGGSRVVQFWDFYH